MSNWGHLTSFFIDTKYEKRCPVCEQKINNVFNLEGIEHVNFTTCSSCKLSFINPRPNKNSLFRYYNNYLENNRKADLGLLEKRRVQYELDRNYLYKFLKNEYSILDVGCSTGEFISDLPFDLQRFGVEPDPFSVETLKKTNIKFIGKDLDKGITYLIENKIEIDIITFRGVLEHTFNPIDTLNNAYKVLSENGKIILLMTPCSSAPALKIFKDNWAMFNPVEHLWFFEEETFEAMNIPLEVERFDYPYLETPYENLEQDIISYAQKITEKNQISTNRAPAFFQNTFNCVLRKKIF